MNRHTLPRALFTVLVAGAAAAQTAVALPPLRADLVDELTLSQISGKYFGANLLVGLRVELTSTLHTAQQGSASASGSLDIRRVGNGFAVSIDSSSHASADVGDSTTAGGALTASGADALQVSGIGQVSQIAGDGNRLANVTTIRFAPALSTGGDAGANGHTGSRASAGAMTAQVTFLDGGVQMGVSGRGAQLAQRFHPQGGGGQLLQMGQIAGNGVVGSNQLQLQVLTGAMSASEQQQLGVQQALAGLIPLGR